MYKLVVDLEMCDRVDRTYLFKMSEVIQIGAILLDADNNIMREFNTYVKPRFSHVSERITSLTGIKSHDVVDAPDIAEALDDLIAFIGKEEILDTVFCSWSTTDAYVLRKELKIKGISNIYIEKLLHDNVDIQREFGVIMYSSQRIGLKAAVDLVDLDFEGVEHDALSDARNTAILYKLIHSENKPKVFKVIDSVMHNKETCTTSLGSLFSGLNLSFSKEASCE